MADAFTMILTAHYSPQNGCLAAEGTVLSVVPKAPNAQGDGVRHHFTSTDGDHKKSKLGWVTPIAPFTFDDFLDRHKKGDLPLTDDAQEHILVMLRSIQSLAPGTPVGATYSVRGVEKRRVVFTVHKVVLFPAHNPGIRKNLSSH